MRAIDATLKRLVTIAPSQTLTKAAELMEERAVGALVVTDGERMTGIVTDRDLVTRGVARRLPGDARIDAVMTTNVVTLEASADLHHAFAVFRTHGIRRLPLVEDGEAVGMLTVDDLLINLCADFADVVRPVTGEVLYEMPLPAR